MFHPWYFAPRYFPEGYFTSSVLNLNPDTILLSIYITREHTAQRYIQRDKSDTRYVLRTLQQELEL